MSQPDLNLTRPIITLISTPFNYGGDLHISKQQNVSLVSNNSILNPVKHMSNMSVFIGP